MARLVTLRRPEEVAQQAQEYVKSYILFPSGMVGLACLIGGIGGLGYQLIATESYTWDTFYQSSGLILVGLVFGMAQTSYHQFLMKRFPEVFAARLRVASMRRGAKAKREPQTVTINHAGRGLVPLVYAGGVAILMGSAFAAVVYGQVGTVAALLLPWAGFFWARLLLWRKVVK